MAPKAAEGMWQSMSVTALILGSAMVLGFVAFQWKRCRRKTDKQVGRVIMMHANQFYTSVQYPGRLCTLPFDTKWQIPKDK